MNKHNVGSALLALLGTGLTITLPALAAAAPDSEQVNQLLADAKSQAYQISLDASTMESYTRSSTTWQTHATAVMQMKEHINAAGSTLAKLDAARKMASPWQATAIDRIKPLLKEIAFDTSAEIDYINSSPQRLMLPAYKDYLEANADSASVLSALISDFVNYGNTKDRLQHLREKLELPAGGSGGR